MRLNTIILAVTWLALLAGSQFLGHGFGDPEPVTVRSIWHVGNNRYAP